jgi:hypothetical protein
MEKTIDGASIMLLDLSTFGVAAEAPKTEKI